MIKKFVFLAMFVGLLHGMADQQIVLGAFKKNLDSSLADPISYEPFAELPSPFDLAIVPTQENITAQTPFHYFNALQLVQAIVNSQMNKVDVQNGPDAFNYIWDPLNRQEITRIFTYKCTDNAQNCTFLKEYKNPYLFMFDYKPSEKSQRQLLLDFIQNTLEYCDATGKLEQRVLLAPVAFKISNLIYPNHPVGSASVFYSLVNNKLDTMLRRGLTDKDSATIETINKAILQNAKDFPWQEDKQVGVDPKNLNHARLNLAKIYGSYYAETPDALKIINKAKAQELVSQLEQTKENNFQDLMPADIMALEDLKRFLRYTDSDDNNVTARKKRRKV